MCRNVNVTSKKGTVTVSRYFFEMSNEWACVTALLVNRHLPFFWYFIYLKLVCVKSTPQVCNKSNSPLWGRPHITNLTQNRPPLSLFPLSQTVTMGLPPPIVTERWIDKFDSFDTESLNKPLRYPWYVIMRRCLRKQEDIMLIFIVAFLIKTKIWCKKIKGP